LFGWDSSVDDDGGQDECGADLGEDEEDGGDHDEPIFKHSFDEAY
jgi:hypothetical protein